MLVDSHCHLDFKVFDDDHAGVIARARAAGVGAMLTIGTTFEGFPGVRAIAETYDDVYCSIGVHPHEADAHTEVEAAHLVKLAEHPKVVGIGETGLDYHYDHSSREEQMRCFRAHLAAARLTGLPAIIHSRNAEADTGALLAEAKSEGHVTGVLHCFSASRELAERCLDLGFHISFSGIVTFKSADELREVARMVPLDRLLVETDAPYLAPVPKRGKPNQPAYVALTAAKVAEVRGMALTDLAAATTDNFFSLFAKARRPADAPAMPGDDGPDEGPASPGANPAA